MKHFFFCFIIIILVYASGCSTLKTSVRKDVDWPAYSSVEISVTEPDRWELRPLVAERLANWGLMPVDENQQSADLLAILEVTEDSGLAETGKLTHWPKNLLLRLHDRSNGTELARSRYQLAPTQSPKHGLTLMVNDLRKHTNKVMGAAPRPQPHENNTATTPALPAPEPTPFETSATAATTTNSERTSASVAPATPAKTPPLEELSEPDPTRSDWAPRFKGWQPWGDSITAEEPY